MQQLSDALVGVLRAQLSQEGLQQFLADWDAVGGAPCSSLRGCASDVLQAGDVDWQRIAFAADALQELCWEKLHTGNWMDVQLAWRDAYTLFVLLAVVAKLVVASAAEQRQQQCGPAAGKFALHQQALLAESLKQLDLAAMMGGRRFRPLLDQATDAVDAQLLALQQQGSRAADATAGTSQAAGGVDEAAQGPAKRARLAAAAAEPLPQAQQQLEQQLLPPGSLTVASNVVPIEEAPSLEHFLMRYMLAPGGGAPAIIRGAMEAWPALSRWQDLGYLSRVAGRRTVPVELGRHYLQEGWGSELMTLDDFITQHLAAGAQQQQQQQQQAGGGAAAGDGAAPAAAAAAAGAEVPSGQAPRRLGYLAQHQLFEQVPALAADIRSPDYCSLGDAGVSAVNAWIGPAGTVTPLHQDPQHNLLAQVVGRKYVRLYDPAHTPRLYPHESGMHTNTSRVDVACPDEAAFPGFSAVPYMDVVLAPGDMLYLPPRWWHYVASLSTSVSVSFWFE